MDEKAPHNSITELVGMVVGVQGNLPFEELQAGTHHAATAAELLSASGEGNTGLSKAAADLETAAHSGAAALAALKVVDDELVAYRFSIAGTGAAQAGGRPAAQVSGGVTAEHAGADNAAELVFAVERQVGDTTFNVVLCEHTAERARAIAAPLAGCNVVAIESPGLADEADRASYEQAGTMLLSSQYDPAVIRELLSTAPGGNAAAIYRELIGSDMQVVLIDTPRDHPDYPVLQRDAERRREYAEAVVAVLPVAETRDRMMAAATAFSQAIEVRDRVMAGQLAELPARFGQARVGVVMGRLHYGAINGLGETAHDDTAAVRQSLQQGMDFSTLVDAIHRGQPPTPQQADRYLLAQHIGVADPELAGIVSRMSDELVARTLAAIDTIAATPGSAGDKRRQTNAYLCNVAELIINPPGAGT